MKLAFGSIVSGVAVMLFGCASPQYESGRLHCATSGKACPQNFYCAADNRCWADGAAPDMTTAMMMGSPDLSPSLPFDLALPAGSDLAGFSPSLCSTAGALFCDGFETGKVDMPNWSDGSSAGSVTVDNTHVYRGQFAMHSHTNTTPAGMESQGALLTHRGLPVIGTLYVRAWVYFASPVTSEFDQFMNFVDSGTGGVSYGMRNGDAVDNDYGSGGYRESTLPIPTDKWSCIRMSISGQSATGTMGDIHLYVDGVEASDAQLLGTGVSQEIGLALGMDLVSPSASVQSQDAWFDEIIIDNKPITCTE